MGDAAITKATTELTLEELAHNMQFDGFISRAANGEMVRRQTKIQMEAAAAQIKAASAQEAAASAAIKAAEAEARAADAAMESAFHARRNAKYMLLVRYLCCRLGLHFSCHYAIHELAEAYRRSSQPVGCHQICAGIFCASSSCLPRGIKSRG